MVDVLEMVKSEMIESNSLGYYIISGTRLPRTLRSAAVVQHEDTFVIIGGWIGGLSYSDKIYRYDASSGVWTKLQTTLSEGRFQVTAMKIKSTAFDSCYTIG